MNSVQNIISGLFDFRNRTIDLTKKQRMALVDRIYQILTPHYFRLGSIDKPTQLMLRQKIEGAVKLDRPITLILAVGGFKGIRIANHPHINWAEVFHLSFLCQTLWEITQIYEPGLVLEFSGDDVIMPLLDNHKSEWTQTYNSEFSKLINIISPLLPKNLSIINNPASNFYDQNQLFAEVQKEMTKTSPEVTPQALLRAKNNYAFNGSQINEDVLKHSVIAHHCWINVDYKHRREYLEGGINIPIIHRKNFPGCYEIRSYNNSDIQFWEGYGIVIRKRDKLFLTILSHNQFVSYDNLAKMISVPSIFSSIESLSKIPFIDFLGTPLQNLAILKTLI